MEGAQGNLAEKGAWMEKAPAVLGASTSLLYVPGPIVVNSYMATKGVTQQPLLILLCHKSSFVLARPQHGHSPSRAIS